jgi:hypothetical protein
MQCIRRQDETDNPTTEQFGMIEHAQTALFGSIFHKLLDQVDPHRQSTTITTRRARRLCGRWLALHRLHLGLTNAMIAECTGVDAQTLLLLESGLADKTYISDEAWNRLCLARAGKQHNVDWVTQVVSIALGRSSVNTERILERVAADLCPTIDDSALESESLSRCHFL